MAIDSGYEPPARSASIDQFGSAGGRQRANGSGHASSQLVVPDEAAAEPGSISTDLAEWVSLTSNGGAAEISIIAVVADKPGDICHR